MALGSIRLRVESGDGSSATEYRIEDGSVEVRTIPLVGVTVQRAGNVWWRLTPEQLSVHVQRNTAVAQWLERRLGWRRLLQACVTQEPDAWKVARSIGT